MMKFLKKYIFLTFLIATLQFLTLESKAQVFTEHSFKFSKVLDWINSYYVDTVNMDKIVEDAIVGLLKDLDPHSTYLTRDEVKEMNEPLRGNFEGIGVQFNILQDTILIIMAIPGGPSEKVGIVAGDRIVKIDSENVAGTGITSRDVMNKLRGNRGTKVTVSVKRRGSDDLLDFTITRDRIPIYSLDASYMIQENTGYIKLNRFSATTVDEFNRTLNELKDKNLKNLILDLSGNGGGYLDEAIKLADNFLEKDKLIVFTEGLNSPRQDHIASAKGNFEAGNLIIIIDEGSASASEIVAGAVQDWDRGIIIGRRSFGKGLVQRPLFLPDGSMIRLTVARYHTPTGRLIQKPYTNGAGEYELDYVSRVSRGELFSRDSIRFSDSLKYFTLEKKRPVYGGGGIMPDIFVPVDTSNYSEYYRDLLRKGAIGQFVLNYVDKNRPELNKKFPDFRKFKQDFKVSDNLFQELVNHGKSENIEPVESEINTSKQHLKLLVKAYIARDLWSSSEFFEIYNQSDNAINKAISIMENWNMYSDNFSDGQDR